MKGKYVGSISGDFYGFKGGKNIEWNIVRSGTLYS